MSAMISKQEKMDQVPTSDHMEERSGRGASIMGCAIGNCVHVAGVHAFLQIAEQLGAKTIYLGPAVSLDSLLEAISQHRPDIIGVSYRLTPKLAEQIFADLEDRFRQADLVGYEPRWLVGGTPKVAEIARRTGFFDVAFVGDEPLATIVDYLRRLVQDPRTKGDPLRLFTPVEAEEAWRFSRFFETEIEGKPLPILRHHFGLPSVDETVAGIAQIAEADCLHVISLASDQNAQEFFFEPEKMRPEFNGAGGVPVRSEEDLDRLYAASQCGNYPRLRIYSGTNRLLDWAELATRTIDNVWGTIPLTWYSELDGRSNRTLVEAIAENQRTMRWYANNDRPVEVNESHHWSLRDAPDLVAVLMAYIAAYNAKAQGVEEYIAQFMMNTPRQTHGEMDLAKMLTKIDLIESLQGEHFRVYRQVRAGLTHFAVDTDVAKGQLATSTVLGMALEPHILHVVGFTEAQHAARPEEVIESCKIVRGVLRNSWRGFPDLRTSQLVIDRRAELLSQAQEALEVITAKGKELGYEDPLASPEFLDLIIHSGIIDAPHLLGCPAANGTIKVSFQDGACRAIDRTGKLISPLSRIQDQTARLGQTSGLTVANSASKTSGWKR
jgi:methylmalonyl-CoA mutase cobalamin-binding subunit